MFRKILAALDRSDLGHKVFEEALTLAQTAQAQLMLLHVLCPSDEGYPDFPPTPGIDTYYPSPQSEVAMQNYLEWWRTYEESGLKLLRSQVETATQAGISTEFSQKIGSPGRTICELASSWEADLIVVGRRGRSGLSELVLGSVSNYVMHHAPCSVLTLQQKSSTP